MTASLDCDSFRFVEEGSVCHRSLAESHLLTWGLLAAVALGWLGLGLGLGVALTLD